MTGPKRLDEVIASFTKTDTPKTGLLTAPRAPTAPRQETEEALHPALVDWLDGLSKLADLLDEETEALSRGDVSRAEEFTRRKTEAEITIRDHARRAEHDGARIPASGREKAAAAIDRLERAAERNAAILGTLRDAVSWIVDAARRAGAAPMDEGLYSRTGKQVGPGRQVSANLDASI